jgi:hypothetical protein
LASKSAGSFYETKPWLQNKAFKAARQLYAQSIPRVDNTNITPFYITDCSSPTNSSASQETQLSSIKLFWQTNEWSGDKSQSVLGEIAVAWYFYF